MNYAINLASRAHRVLPKGEPPTPIETVVQADADGWIEWYGGAQPLPDGHLVEAKHRNGETYREPCGVYGSEDWSHTGLGGDIVAYRPILDDVPEPLAWDGQGLPPAGTECEWKHKSADGESWQLCQIVGYHSEWVIVAIGGNGGMPRVQKVATWRFRPIRTDRERWLEKACKRLGCKSGSIAADWLGNLYDALQRGDLPLPKTQGDT